MTTPPGDPADPADPAAPRPAATVAILRDGAAGLEVWLMRRHAAMAFAAGMQAFPGGAVEPADHDDALPWIGRDPLEVAAVFGVDVPVARALVSAAVRETFEECGALFADGAHPAPHELEAARDALVRDGADWPGFLRTAGLAVDGSALVPWARWITPDWSPIRFDAFFFVASCGEAVDPRMIEGEADDAGWTGVRDVVAAHERGDLPMLAPTISTLRELAVHTSVAEVLAGAPRRIAAADG